MTNAASELPDAHPKTQRHPREQRYQTIGYFSSFVGLGMAAAVLGPTLPELAANTRTLLGGISFLFTARSLGYLLGSFLGGTLYDRVRGHPLMATTLVAMALLLALIPLLSVLWLLALIVLVFGLVEGVVDVGGNTLLMWVYRERVAPYMNGLHFFFGLGAFLSPILIAQAVRVTGEITWAYWLQAVLMLPLALWLLRVPSPAARVDSVAARSEGAYRPSNPAQKRLLIWLFVIFFYLYVAMEIGFGGWIFTYATHTGLTGEMGGRYLNSAFFGAFTLGRLLAIPIAARLSPRTFLLGDLTGALASVGLILLWPESVLILWLGSIGLGFAMASIFPTMLSLAESQLVITGRVTSWFFIGSSAGGMTLPWLIGQLFESAGPGAMMFAILIDILLALAVLGVLVTYSARLAAQPEESVSFP